MTSHIIFAGVDEAGRGCICGDVVVAAVILDPSKKIIGLNDSKKITENKRKILFDEIIEKSLAFSIKYINSKTIDKLNILQASLVGMKKAVEGLKVKPKIVYVDGNHAPQLNMPVVKVIKGDQLIQSISAASILAKVARDQQMIDLHEKYPQYGYQSHKGYPTKFHLEKLSQYGILDCYRTTYKPIRELIQNGQ